MVCIRMSWILSQCFTAHRCKDTNDVNKNESRTVFGERYTQRNNKYTDRNESWARWHSGFGAPAIKVRVFYV